MSFQVCEAHHDEWADNSLADYGSFSDCITECNQRDRGDYSIGEWFYIPDEVLPPMQGVDYGGVTPNERAIYHGTWGNDNSPGASHYTYADVYDMDDPEDAAQYEADVKEWKAQPEWIDEGPSEEDEDDTDEDDDDEESEE